MNTGLRLSWPYRARQQWHIKIINYLPTWGKKTDLGYTDHTGQIALLITNLGKHFTWMLSQQEVLSAPNHILGSFRTAKQHNFNTQ